MMSRGFRTAGMGDPVDEGIQNPEIRQIQGEFQMGRWQNIAADLEAYLRLHAEDLIGAPLDEVLKLRRMTRGDLRAALLAGRAEGDEALSGAVACHLVEVRTIASKDEYDEQLRGLRDAIWFEGERLRRGLSKEETEAIIYRHLELDPPGFRDHIVHVILFVFRERRAKLLPILREAFLQRAEEPPIWPGAI